MLFFRHILLFCLVKTVNHFEITQLIVLHTLQRRQKRKFRGTRKCVLCYFVFNAGLNTYHCILKCNVNCIITIRYFCCYYDEEIIKLYNLWYSLRWTHKVPIKKWHFRGSYLAVTQILTIYNYLFFELTIGRYWSENEKFVFTIAIIFQTRNFRSTSRSRSRSS